MDEPTAALTGTETARLFSVVDTLQAEVDRSGSVVVAHAIADVTGAVAIHDGEDHPLAATAAYGEIAAALHFRSTARLRSGELDYTSDVDHDETGTYVTHHAAIRRADTSLAAIVTVGRRIERGAPPPASPRVDSTD
jgi:hypothetical protein